MMTGMVGKAEELPARRNAIKEKGGVRVLLDVLLKSPNEEAPICDVTHGLLASLSDVSTPDLALQVTPPGPAAWQTCQVPVACASLLGLGISPHSTVHSSNLL